MPKHVTDFTGKVKMWAEDGRMNLSLSGGGLTGTERISCNLTSQPGRELSRLIQADIFESFWRHKLDGHLIEMEGEEVTIDGDWGRGALQKRTTSGLCLLTVLDRYRKSFRLPQRLILAQYVNGLTAAMGWDYATSSESDPIMRVLLEAQANGISVHADGSIEYDDEIHGRSTIYLYEPDPGGPLCIIIDGSPEKQGEFKNALFASTDLRKTLEKTGIRFEVMLIGSSSQQQKADFFAEHPDHGYASRDGDFGYLIWTPQGSIKVTTRGEGDNGSSIRAIDTTKEIASSLPSRLSDLAVLTLRCIYRLQDLTKGLTKPSREVKLLLMDSPQRQAPLDAQEALRILSDPATSTPEKQIAALIEAGLLTS